MVDLSRPPSRRRSFASSSSFHLLLLLVVAAAIRIATTHACTTIIVGRKATNDGSLMTTHNNDCEDCDVRIAVVPETTNEPGSLCPIHPCGFDFPRYVGFDRGAAYEPAALEQEELSGPSLPETRPLGHIPEVKSTYRYLDGTYGMMNEHGLAIGESTCGAKLVAFSRARGGDALFDISALTRLALQRCATAQCAIELMGSLAEAHGYAGSEDPVEDGTDLFEVAGEALTLIDTHEAWVFHMLADTTGRSAIWAAQRVPDDHLAVVPNKFIIDRMNLSDADNFRASHDIRRKAIDAGLLAPEEDEGDDAFEFSRAFALDYRSGENSRSAPGEQLNSNEGERRRWRIFSLVAPSRGFRPDQRERFPFSVRVETPLALEDVQRLMRDHFENTPFDATRGLAAGPYGNPNRFDHDVALQPETAHGFFERTISIHRTSYSFVAVSHPGRPREGVVWLAHHSPQNSVYLPLYAAAQELPPSFGRGTLFRLSRDSAWWAFAAVANSAERMYQPIHEVIAAEQQRIESDARELVAHVSEKSRQLTSQGQEKEALQVMTDFTVDHSQKVVARWWLLLDELTAKFRDGVMVQSSHPPLLQSHIFYPIWWLHAVGYFDRGALSQPQYPPVPIMPSRLARMSARTTTAPRSALTPMSFAVESRRGADDPDDDIDQSAGLTDRDTSSGSSEDHRPSSSESNMWSDPHRRTLLIGLFAFSVLLVSLICFQLGNSWGRRQAMREYTPIRDEEEEVLSPSRRFPTVQPEPRVRATVR